MFPGFREEFGRRFSAVRFYEREILRTRNGNANNDVYQAARKLQRVRRVVGTNARGSPGLQKTTEATELTAKQGETMEKPQRDINIPNLSFEG